MTQFTHTRVPVGHGLELVIDGNSKITCGNGTYAAPAPNAFSLPAASVSGPMHCPGSTPTCRSSCYVKGLAKFAPDVYAAYAANAAALDVILASPGVRRGFFDASAEALGAWITANASDGFRWHVSGDVRGELHAHWIACVAHASHGVRHWIYTRTLEAVPELMRAPNLVVNVSADLDNAEVAIPWARKHEARVCYMSTVPGDIPTMELRDDDVVFPDYPMRGRDLPIPTEALYWKHASHRMRSMTCPADFFGQSESARCGPCTKCLVHPVASVIQGSR